MHLIAICSNYYILKSIRKSLARQRPTVCRVIYWWICKSPKMRHASSHLRSLIIISHYRVIKTALKHQESLFLTLQWLQKNVQPSLVSTAHWPSHLISCVNNLTSSKCGDCLLVLCNTLHWSCNIIDIWLIKKIQSKTTYLVFRASSLWTSVFKVLRSIGTLQISNNYHCRVYLQALSAPLYVCPLLCSFFTPCSHSIHSHSASDHKVAPHPAHVNICGFFYQQIVATSALTFAPIKSGKMPH